MVVDPGQRHTKEVSRWYGLGVALERPFRRADSNPSGVQDGTKDAEDHVGLLGNTGQPIDIACKQSRHLRRINASYCTHRNQAFGLEIERYFQRLIALITTTLCSVNP